MKLATFIHKNKSPRLGILEGDTIVSVPWIGTMQTFIESGITPGRTSETFPLSESRLLPPLRPGKIIAVGRNYAEHVAEMGNQVPANPFLFAKFPSSVIGHGEAIQWRESITQKVDYEGELAVIIGRKGKDISEADAPKHIFGYTIANDVSARDLQESESQWARAKSLDTFCPLGPVIVLRSAIEDPHALTIQTQVNGEMRQDGKTSDMIHNIYALIAYCSQAFTLEPGDVLLTGSPSGVGKATNRFLGDGDEVAITIEPIGTLTNSCQVISD